MGEPTEAQVRASLHKRPAGILYRFEREGARDPARTFTSLFNGAHRKGWYATHGPNQRPIFGKAETEWGWPHDFQTLRDAGLITYTINETDAPGLIGGRATDIHWGITDKGWEVREDDLKWFSELMAAMERDEKLPDPPNPPA